MITREEARALWISKLESGEYSQGKNYLHDNDKWCCLGVACDLFAEELEIPRGKVVDSKFGDRERFGLETMYLPQQIVKLLGLYDWTGGNKNRTKPSLSQLNDRGSTFSGIVAALNTGEFWE